MIAWLDMESRRKRRRHRQCPGFYLVSCGHSDSTNQERSLREGLGFRNKMLNSILDIFNSSTKTHLFTLWAPLVQGDNKKTDTHLTFRIFIFVLICSSVCLARNHSNQIPSNSRITKSRKFTQGFQQPPPILSPLSHLTSHFILKNQEERRLLMLSFNLHSNPCYHSHFIDEEALSTGWRLRFRLTYGVTNSLICLGGELRP